MRVSILFLLLICLTFFSCQKEDSSHKAQSSFKIGIILPLTGALAEYGIAVKNAFELARKNYPDKFNNINFIYEDSEYNGVKAIAAFQKLTKTNNVNLIYNWGTAPNEAVIPLAEKGQIPNIVATVDTNIVANKTYSIRAMPNSKDFATLLDKYFEEKNITKIGLIKNEIAYFDAIIKELDQNKIQFIESVPVDSNDFKSLISKIQNKNIDSLGVFILSGQISQFYTQAKNLNFAGKTFGTDFFDSKNEVSKSGELINGATFASIAVTEDFLNQYLNSYGNDLQIGFAGSAYDIVVMLGTLFNQETTLDSQQIMNKIKNLTPRDGVAGRFSFRETKEAGMELRSPAQLKIINNQNIENYKFN